MKEKVVEHLDILFKVYDELIESSSGELLAKSIEVSKSKTLGEHLWCVIGARESYARSLIKGEWTGFNCSLAREDINDREQVSKHLSSSSEAARRAIEGTTDWTEDRKELLLNLLEHETMHEGQIIRLVYGLNEALPQSWIERWA